MSLSGYQRVGFGDDASGSPDTFYADLGSNIKSLVMTGIAGWILVKLWGAASGKSGRKVSINL